MPKYAPLAPPSPASPLGQKPHLRSPRTRTASGTPIVAPARLTIGVPHKSDSKRHAAVFRPRIKRAERASSEQDAGAPAAVDAAPRRKRRRGARGELLALGFSPGTARDVLRLDTLAGRVARGVRVVAVGVAGDAASVCRPPAPAPQPSPSASSSSAAAATAAAAAAALEAVTPPKVRRAPDVDAPPASPASPASSVGGFAAVAAATAEESPASPASPASPEPEALEELEASEVPEASSSSSSSSAAAVPSPQPQPRRGRGRPRGTKNATTSATTTARTGVWTYAAHNFKTWRGLKPVVGPSTVGIMLDYFWLQSQYYAHTYGTDWLTSKAPQAFAAAPRLAFILLPYDRDSSDLAAMLADGGSAALRAAGLAHADVSDDEARELHPLVLATAATARGRPAFRAEAAGQVARYWRTGAPFLVIYRRGADWRAALRSVMRPRNRRAGEAAASGEAESSSSPSPPSALEALSAAMSEAAASMEAVTSMLLGLAGQGGRDGALHRHRRGTKRKTAVVETDATDGRKRKRRARLAVDDRDGAAAAPDETSAAAEASAAAAETSTAAETSAAAAETEE